MNDKSTVSETTGVEDDSQRDGQTEIFGDASRNGAGGATDTRVMGKVASPPRRESTSEQFHFWVPGDKLVEKTQIVRTDSRVGGRDISFYATVTPQWMKCTGRAVGAASIKSSTLMTAIQATCRSLRRPG